MFKISLEVPWGTSTLTCQTSRCSGNGAVSWGTSVEVGMACNTPLLTSVSNSLSVLPGNGLRIPTPTSPVGDFNSNVGCWTRTLGEPTQPVRPNSESSETAIKEIGNRLARATGEPSAVIIGIGIPL